MTCLRTVLLCSLLAPSPLAQTPGGPGLPWSAFLGGSGFDECEAWNQVCLARNGDVLVCGRTASANFPRTSGPVLQGVEDGFVARLRGGQVVWAVLIGGDGRDAVRAVLEDGNGDLLIAGRTSSTSFPVTAGALQTTYGGGSAASGDGFVARLTNAVAGPPTVGWATYLGGAGDDSVVTLAIDVIRNRIVAGGWTASTAFPFPFPMPPNPYQPAHAGPAPGPNALGADGFVAVLDPSAQGSAQLAFATFLGGSGDDILVDVAFFYGAVLVSGRTSSANFPTTQGAFDQSLGGTQDAFVAVLDPSLTSLSYGTYLGGDGRDIPYGMAITFAGDVVLGGETTSVNFPTTPNALQQSFAGGGSLGIGDAFLARLDLGQTGPAQLTWATYLGGPGDEAVMDLAVERSGMITAVGLAGSPPFPWTTPGALQPTFQGGGGPPLGPADGFVVRLDPSQNGNAQLVYGTFLGGSQGQENATDIALTATGGAVVVGWTRSPDFPASGIYRGNSDAFVAELDMLPAGVARYGSLSPQMAYGTVNSMPARGNTAFEVQCNTREPGWLVFGAPDRTGTSLPSLGFTAYLSLSRPTPVAIGVVPSVTARYSTARYALPIPATIPPGSGIACQWVLLSPGCNPFCAPPFFASDRLDITVQ